MCENKAIGIHALEEPTPRLKASELVDLPSELISLVVEYLPKDDLCTLRQLHNQRIASAIDTVFVSRSTIDQGNDSGEHSRMSFCHLVCRTTRTSLAYIKAVSGSRFAPRIRTLEIFIDLECIPKRPGTWPACMIATIYGLEARIFFKSLFQRMRAPSLDSLLRPGIFIDLWEIEYMGHDHTMDPVSYRSLLDELIHAALDEIQRLEHFSILGYTVSQWQSVLAETKTILQSITATPDLQTLTTLNLELEMYTDTTDCMLKKIGKIIGRNSNLNVLKLDAGPETHPYCKSNKHWVPLIWLLGSDPPFRLQTLEIDGLVASSTAPSLAHIIKTHSPSLRRLVLRNTNFGPLNTIRAFFEALAESEVRYYAWKMFLVHRAGSCSFLTSSHLVYEEVEVLASEVDIDTTPTYSLDTEWVNIIWQNVPLHKMSVWDDLRLKGDIKAAFRNVVMAMDCGAI
ncbi:hypothetical protein GMOD_00000424 [Pyrenophora seminiperda CCB06]|uniref:F-box domain-containing protein n=1 Tax=Pyrenophora seminiperda CCB06 TaxID=1302712 RepID=A0A3M7M7A3_9PLEO|nr:hypothetical protein GMOD_00000424 [Pyrenophora seminiperda CCB06]